MKIQTILAAGAMSVAAIAANNVQYWTVLRQKVSFSVA